MKIAAFSIADYCEATEGMPHDVERLYFRMLMKMFSRESGLPNDDRENARIFGYDIRTYRTLKSKLLAWPNALAEAGDMLVNIRVEKELMEIRARKDRREVQAKSARSSGEVGAKLGRIPHTTNCKNNGLCDPSPSPSPSPSPNKKDRSFDSPIEDRLRPAAIPRFVSEAALDRLRTVAPGWDRQFLLQKFTEWPGSKSAVDVDKAFVGWAKSFTKGQSAWGTA